MERSSSTLIGLILIIVVSQAFTGCSNEDPADQNGYLQSKLVEIENAILLKQFNTTPASLGIFNISYFSKAAELKYATSDIERNRIKTELCGYDLSTSKFSGQQKHDSPQLTDEERIIYESFLNSFSNSKENSVAICEFFISEVSCLKIDDQVKSDFVDRITFFKDLLIFIDNKPKKEMVFNDELDKVVAVPFDDCFDDCMISEIRHATSSTLRTAFFILHLPFKAAEMTVICVGDCI
jgi:hypothetical protein